MFGFGKQAAIDAATADLRAEKVALESQLAARNLELIRVRSDSITKGNIAAELLKERDAALAELAPLKAAKNRQLQNLRDANARRAAKAREGLVGGEAR